MLMGGWAHANVGGSLMLTVGELMLTRGGSLTDPPVFCLLSLMEESVPGQFLVVPAQRFWTGVDTLLLCGLSQFGH